MFRSIQKRVKHWHQAGLISESQGGEILFYENNQRVFSQTLMQVARIFILLGALAIVGSSWVDVTLQSKLSTLLLITAGLAFTSHVAYQRVYIKLFEASMLLLYIAALSFLITLSFWYQLTIEPYQIVLTWAFLTFPSTFLVRWPVTLFAWVLLATAGLYGFVMNYVSHDHIMQLNCILSFPFSLGILAAIGPRHLKSYFAWEGILSFSAIVMALSYSNTLQLEEQVWLTIPALCSLLFFTALKRIKKINTSESFAWIMLLVLYNLLIVTNYVLLHTHGIVINFVVVFLSILCLSAAAFIAHLKKSALFSRSLLAICLLRALLWYFEALGGMLFTGIGLIVTGFTLYTATYMLSKGYQLIVPNFAQEIK